MLVDRLQHRRDSSRASHGRGEQKASGGDDGLLLGAQSVSRTAHCLPHKLRCDGCAFPLAFRKAFRKAFRSQMKALFTKFV